MAEYIEREAAYTIAKKICDAIRNGEYHSAVFAYGIMDWIDDVPAADVVPVRHGRWLTKEYMYGDPDVGIGDMWVDRAAEQSDYFAYCSFCGEDAGYNNDGELILSNYCSNCGAIMDKEGTNGETVD